MHKLNHTTLLILAVLGVSGCGGSDKEQVSPIAPKFEVQNQNFTLSEDSKLSVEIEHNNPLGTDEPISLNIKTNVLSGKLSGDFPNLLYTPNENFHGEDKFTFELIQKDIKSSEVTVKFTVASVNDAPTITGTPTAKLTAGEEYSFVPKAADIDKDNLVFSIKKLPEWLNFNTKTGEIKGTPSNTNGGTYSDILMTVSDGEASAELPAFSIEVAYTELDAPTGLEHAVTSTFNKLKPISLNWNAVEHAANYELQFASDELFENVINNQIINSTSAQLEQPAGLYYWRVRTINPNLLAGPWGDAQSIEAGIFTQIFGGNGDDRAAKIIDSSDGGYVALTTTKSLEVNTRVDSAGDDWIIKVDFDGNVKWQYLLNMPGQPKLIDIVELSDGSFLAVGTDKEEQKGIALKLNSDGVEQWKTIYASPTDGYRYAFNSVVEANNSVYIASKEEGLCNQGCDYIKHSLHTVEKSAGTISDAIDIPEIPDFRIYEHSLFTNNDNQLVVTGYIVPSVINPDYDPDYADINNFYDGGPFIQVLDKDLASEMVWKHVGNIAHLNADKLTQATNGDYILIGGSRGDGPNIAIVTKTGNEKVVGVVGTNSDIVYHTGSKSLIQTSENTFATIVEKREVGSELIEFDTNLNITRREYLDGPDHLQSIHSPQGLLKNPDGTLTYLLNRYVRENNNNNIAIMKK